MNIIQMIESLIDNAVSVVFVDIQSLVILKEFEEKTEKKKILLI